MTVYEAIQKLNGQELKSHKEIHALCTDSVKSVRRVGPELNKLIEDGLITGGSYTKEGLTRFKYEIVS